MKNFKRIDTLRYLDPANLPPEATENVCSKICDTMALNAKVLKLASKLQVIEGNLFLMNKLDPSFDYTEFISTIDSVIETADQYRTSIVEDSVLEVTVRNENSGTLVPSNNPLIIFSAYAYDIILFNLRLLRREAERIRKEIFATWGELTYQVDLKEQK